MDRMISLEDAIEAVNYNPVYADKLRECRAVEDVIEDEIRILESSKRVDENIIKAAEEFGELMQALSKWRDVLNDYDSRPDDWYEAKDVVVGELADAIIMTRIIRCMCGITSDEMWEKYREKMERNLRRAEKHG